MGERMIHILLTVLDLGGTFVFAISGAAAAVKNDPDAEQRVVSAFTRHFRGRVRETLPTSASEDFGCFGTAWHVPSVFWFVGGIDRVLFERAQKSGRLGEIPTNHNPRFAPVIHPTLETGVEALIVAARAWLAA